MEKIKFTVVCAFSFGLICSIFSFILYFGDWQRLVIVFFMGAFVGLLAAPEFKPKLYKNIALFQVVSGSIAGLLAAIVFAPSAKGTILGFLLGGLLGLLAPYWVKHFPVP